MDTGLVKSKRILEEVVFKYHNVYKDKSQRKKNEMLENPQHFRIETLCEELVASCMNVERTDTKHKDFSNGKELKTAGVHPISRRCSLTNIQSKTGDVLAIVYNSVLDKMDYFYIPNDKIDGLAGKICNGESSIRFCYSKIHNRYTRVHEYMVDSFDTMITKGKEC